MSMTARRLARGDWVWFNEARRQIIAITGTEVQLRCPPGEWTGISAADLLASPGFRFLDAAQGAEAQSQPGALDLGAVIDCMDDTQQGRLRELEAHLLEARYGYRSGDPQRPAPGEPRPAYDPALVPLLSDRMQAKASELGIGIATMWRRYRRYRSDGLQGLLSGNSTRSGNRLARADPRLINAIVLQHHVGESEDSTGNMSRFCRRLQDRLDDEHGPGIVKVPSQRTVARYLDALLPGRHTLGAATTRRSEAARPQRAFVINPAVRPGQVVMIDATPLDVIAYDAPGDVTHQVQLVAAIDVATRTQLAWRMTVGDTRAVDTVLLLDDAITPQPLRPGWEGRLRYEMARLPVPRIVDLRERLELAAARPVIWPEQILVDHHKVNLSDALREACQLLGINLGLARKGHPTDKAHIEQAFRVINEDFSKHVAGYKGPNVSRRGRLVEHAARWGLEDLEEFFAEYVVSIYQQRVHSGLTVPGFPELQMSPNEAYSQAVALFGYIACPPQNHHYCDMLPIDYRVIRPEGIQRNYLIYDDPVLGGYRRALSPIRGMGRTWPIRYHPNDPSRIFIKLAGQWQVLEWTHLPDTKVPFTGRMVEQAYATLVHAGVRSPSQQEIAEALVDLQRRMDAPESSTARTRRELTRARQDARTIRRDQQRAGLEESPAPTLHLVPAPAEDEPIGLDELDELPVWDPGAPP